MLFLALLSGEPVVVGKGALAGMVLGLLLVIVSIYALTRKGRNFFPWSSKSPQSNISEDEVFNFLVQRNRWSTVSASYIARGLDARDIYRVLCILRSLAAAGKIRRVTETCSGAEEFGLLKSTLVERNLS
jgi:hypothetical protein